MKAIKERIGDDLHSHEVEIRQRIEIAERAPVQTTVYQVYYACRASFVKIVALGLMYEGDIPEELQQLYAQALYVLLKQQKPTPRLHNMADNLAVFHEILEAPVPRREELYQEKIARHIIASLGLS